MKHKMNMPMVVLTDMNCFMELYADRNVGNVAFLKTVSDVFQKRLCEEEWIEAKKARRVFCLVFIF